jgi:outer membrane protein TolC
LRRFYVKFGQSGWRLPNPGSIAALAFYLACCVPPGAAQCAGVVADLPLTANCTARITASAVLAAIDPDKPYSLNELIDIAESNNPQARISWEQAKQAAERVGIARSEYFPHLAGIALLGNEKFINPFPRPLAPHGYTMVENPSAYAGLAVEYTMLDFGRRRAHLETGRALQMAAAANFQRANQEVAYRVLVAYYNLATAQEELTAMRQILTTARTTQAAAETQLASGRATLPDVLNARAGTAHAEYELEAGIGDEEMARVKLREALGVEPSDSITIEKPATQSEASEVSNSVAELVEAAMHDRPDLASLAEKLRAAKQEERSARSSYRPTVEFETKGAVQSIWPTVSKQDGSALADTTQFVWNAGIRIHWDSFDGGMRKNEVLERNSEQRQAAEELREKRDSITRETWMAYLQYRTAVRQQQAAQSLLAAATTSYDASLDAYGYGVKDLIDLINAETQLAEARLADVQARSAVLTSMANLGYTTGNLLRQKPNGPGPNQP